MLVEHHTKYKETHGVDETVWMSQSEHLKLHRRLRREGKCKTPVDELNKISQNARCRTKKGKADRNKRQRESYIRNRFHFWKNVAPKISLFEDLVYYPKTGTIGVFSYFEGNNGNKLLRVNI